ncbi:50S ribosomal protein L17 [Patescibacteria group bacterium]
MRHRKKGRKFGRVRKQRRGFLSSLASNLIIYEKVHTTEARAKSVKPYIDKLVSKAKKGDLSSRRMVEAVISKRATKKLFSDIAPKFKERKGSVVRIIKIAKKRSDAAKMCVIEFIS